MSELSIAKIIARKRREKGVTQEELAEYVGVSNGAVSKWEKGLSFPDITLLPRLAAYFNVSVDALLGYSPRLTRADIRKLCNSLSADFMVKPFDEAMAEFRTAVKKYYSSYALLYHLAMLLINQHQLLETQERQDEVMLEAKALCERIVLECGDALLAKDALYLQSYCCIALRLPEEVFALIGETVQMPWCAEDTLISEAYRLTGNIAKATEAVQCGMLTHLLAMIESALSYIPLCEDAPDTAESAYRRAMELITLFDVDKIHPFLAAKVYLVGVELNCMKGHSDKALDLLEKLTKLYSSIPFPVKHPKHPFFSAVDRYLEDSAMGSIPPFDERMIRQILLNALVSLPSLSVLHDHPRYKHLIRTIHDIANAEPARKGRR